MISSIQKNIQSLLEYIFVLCLILSMNSVWSVSVATPNFKLNLMLMILLTIVLNIFSKRYWKQKYVLSSLKNILVFSLIMLVFIFFNRYNISYFIQLCTVVVFFILYYNIYLERTDVYRILDKIQKVILVIAVISLIFWFVGPIFKLIAPTSTMMVKWFKEFPTPIQSYYGIQFQTQVFLSSIPRNTGFYIEAPMYAWVLSIGYAIRVLLLYKKNVRGSTILLVTILSTFSLTGIVVSLFITSLVLYTKFSEKISLRGLQFILIPLLMILIASVTENLLEVHASGGSSSAIRLDDFRIGYQVWKDYPIFGSGFGNTQNLKNLMGLWRQFNTGYSNSVMLVLAQGGLYLFTLYVVCFARGLIKSLLQTKEQVFILMLMTLISVTIVPYEFLTIFLLLFCFYMPSGYSEKTSY